jgi:hypothetical protein
MRGPRGRRPAPTGGGGMRGAPAEAAPSAVRRGVRFPRRGYDRAALPTHPAVPGVCARGANVYDIPGSRALAAGGAASLDFGVALGGCLALRGEQGTSRTDRGSEARMRGCGSGESAREMER